MLTLPDVARQLLVPDDPERAASEYGLSFEEIKEAAEIAAYRQDPHDMPDRVNAFVNGFMVGMYVSLAWRRSRSE